MFDGYLKVYGTKDDEDTIPSFELGKSYNSLDVYILDKTTEPKSRYTEASLIKDMEEKGIGRPSTYAQTLHTLKERKYVSLEKKFLVPTEQGILTTNKLKEYFSDIINVKYTANMESKLDQIAKGEETKLNELNEFYDSFQPVFEKANQSMEKIGPKLLDELCPVCGKPLCVRKSRYNTEFVGCSNYPKCKYIKPTEKEVPDEDTNIVCPKCGTGHIVKKQALRGANKGKFFYACSNYPKCKNIYSDMPTENICPKCGAIMLLGEDNNLYCSAHCENNTDFVCPTCGKGHLIKRVATRGKNKGNEFYACSNFPRCKAIFNELPIKKD
jgi:DNA topoisomerase-1